MLSTCCSSSIAMETSPACVSRLVSSSSSSVLFSPFSDQSHLDFYHHRSTSLPSLSLRSSPSRSLWRPSASSLLAALCESSCVPPLLAPASEQNSLMKELAELKLQMKQKKKELKSQKKDEKKRLKLHEKEGKKIMKHKDGIEGEKKKKCQSESSSSSESSEDECKSMSMRTLRQERSLLCNSEDMSARASSCCEGSCVGDSTPSLMEAVCIARDYVEAPSSRERRVSFNGETGRETPAVSSSMCCPGLNSAFTQAPNRIEVCAGGKCKKAGSEQLLLALGAQLPSSSNVAVVPCKCMGKCSMTMNVKVHKEDTNSQHHSHVRVEDVNLILSHHFGLGCPSSGLPSLPSQDRTRVPLTTSA